MSFFRAWILLASADWTVRVISGVFIAGGLALSAETWLSLVLVPPLEAAVLLGVVRIGRAVRSTREAGP